MPIDRLTRIDGLTRPDHSYLDDDDVCYFLGEYTARQGFAFSETNQLIYNLKKGVEKRGKPEWYYKERAIETVAHALRRNISDDWLANTGVLVPIPPSKAKTDPAYDDRMVRVLAMMTRGVDADIREIVYQTESTDAAHTRSDRPSPSELVKLYAVDETVTDPAPKAIAVFDDLLTTGSHFKAMQQVLGARFPGVPIVGLFVARRVPEAEDFDAIFGPSDE